MCGRYSGQLLYLDGLFFLQRCVMILKMIPPLDLHTKVLQETEKGQNTRHSRPQTVSESEKQRKMKDDQLEMPTYPCGP